MIFGLMPLVALATIVIAVAAGLWAIVTIYFYWQWFHYTRQSWGVSRAYRGKEPDALYEDGWSDQAIFYALPVIGILYRSYQSPGKFLGADLVTLPVPHGLMVAVAAVGSMLLAYWIVRRIVAFIHDRLSAVHTLYMLSHFTIFTVSYLLIEDITLGWLVINIWHNAQYILFVWLFNTRRFKHGLDEKALFLSYISQPIASVSICPPAWV
jgi:hypothetical protein